MGEDREKDQQRPQNGDMGAFPTRSLPDSPQELGTQIGPYKLLSVLGEGGFGIVYLAEQQRPVRRQVALKIIKPGMDSKQVIARFEAEQQALALLDHPNIAHVFDAGATQDGHPYFAMEYVRGMPITEHCDKNKLTIEERLKLFQSVCQAVQHAHQKGIIHRDIKPSNILVLVEGQNAVPKVIDFGVAKALGRPLTDRTFFTEQGQLIGTPEYMSPEQAEMAERDIDTRTDVYSLGVVLYELLTGALPFDPDTLRSAAIGEIQRIIRDEEPPKPSTRLSSLGEEATKIAQSRRTDAATLARRLYKELEWIPMMAMRKERDRRYRSAADLGQDIENYVNGDPLIAGPESVAYRIRKSLQKHKAQTLAVLFAVAALIAGIFIGSMTLERTFVLKSVAFTPNGVIREAKISDVNITVLEPRTHTEIMAVPRLNSGATRFALSPRGVYLAASRSKGGLTVWKVDSRTELGGFEGHQRPIVALAFSWDEGYLCSYSADGTIKIWSVPDGRAVSTLPTDNTGITALALGPSAQYVVLGDKDGRLIVCETSSGSEVTAIKAHRSSIATLAFSPSGAQIVSGSKNGEIKTWAWESADVQDILPILIKQHSQEITAVAFDQDGSIAWASLDSTLTVLDSATGVELMRLDTGVYVIPTNHAPVLDVIGNKSVDESSGLTFSVGAQDVDGDAVVFLAENLPTGATFADQVFRWTPTFDQAGSYQVKFIASDRTYQDSETVTIEVRNVNRPPKFADVSDKTVNEGTLVAFTVRATDLDGDTIKYSAKSLPLGAVFVDRTFSWTPNYAQAGAHLVEFVADDGQSQTSASVEVVVKRGAAVELAKVTKQEAGTTSADETDTDQAIGEDGPKTAPECLAAPYTLTVTARHGSVTVTPNKAQYNEGEAVELIPRPDTSYCFTGWTGDVRRKGLVLNLTMDGNKTITANFGVWQPPMGIPSPEFGISETYRMYDVPANRNPVLTYTQNAEGGYYTHYIDKTDPNATDTSNTYGSIAKPRLTIPTTIAAGSVVEIHGGTYTTAQDYYQVTANGTIDLPVFMRGISTVDRPVVGLPMRLVGSYLILENMNFTGGNLSLHGNNTQYYMSVRSSEFQNEANAGIRINDSQFIVIYNNEIHHNIENPPVGDYGFSGIEVMDGGSVGVTTYKVWIVDNHIHDNGKDGLQQLLGQTEYVYIGRNLMHDDRENAIDLKNGKHCIVSQNTCYGYLASESSNGDAIRLDDEGPLDEIWVIFNEVYASNYGIESYGTTFTAYMIGNVIHNLTGPAAAGIHGGYAGPIINNTIYDVVTGVDEPSSVITNNIVSQASKLHIKSNVEMHNNLLWQGGGSVIIQGTAECVNCIQADPLFINADNNDLRLQPTSPAGAAATSSGVVQEVYDRFETLYGIDIRKDIEGTSLTAPWDIGAYKSENRAPILAAIGNKSANVNSLLTFTISATDPDGDTVTYSAPHLPTGATLTGQNFTWTPTSAQVGTHNITFIASDGALQDSEVVAFTVSNTNRPPALDAIPDKFVNENTLLTFEVSATDPDGDPLSYSATGLPGGATFVGQTFSWTPSSSQTNSSHQVTFTTGDGQLNDSQIVTITVTDTLPPSVTNLSPAADSIQVPLNSLIVLHVIDAGSVTITLDGGTIYSGNTSNYVSATGNCRRIGAAADYTYAYQASQNFDFDQTKTVAVNATSLAGNVMTQVSYSFKTEIRSFGQNKLLGSDIEGLDKGAPATVRDSSGNIWAVWHAGPAGSRDIYLAKLTPGSGTFGAGLQITTDAADQCNPAIALGTDDKLYVVWQDNRLGDWDVYGSTSTGGTTWSGQQRISDSNDNQINPAIAVDRQSPNRAHVVWQDDRAGNQDIYIATSSNSFVTNTPVRITSNTADQTAPAVAASSSNTVYVLWMDARNSSKDIYGAAGSGWTNVPVVTKAADQSSPAIAVESTGSILHILWVDQTSGNSDIYYASSNGLPGSPLTGTNLIDDTSGAEQTSPAIAVTGSAGSNLKVFACWLDERNVSGSTADTDIYLVQTNSDSVANAFINDATANSNQTEPAMGIDQYGYPYIVWTDDRDANTEIYFAASTFMQSSTLASQLITAASGGTVGTDPASITGVDDVSIVLPAGACPYDVTIAITRIENPHEHALPLLNAYDFGPSGIVFNMPVTITIPYAVTAAAGVPTTYWCDSRSGDFSQQGITDVEVIVITPTLHALRFKTTHFTPFYVALASGATTSTASGGSGGGCCSMSPTLGPEWPNGRSNVVEL